VPAARTDKQSIVIEMLKDNPEVSKRRLAMMLAAKHPGLFPSAENARSTIRYYTESNGKSAKERRSRGEVQVPEKVKEPRSGSKVYSCPPSKAKPWLPYEVEGKLVAIFSDCHFPKHDVAAIESAVAHVKDFGDVDTVLLNGDFADAEEFSSWAKSPKAIDTENTLECIRQGLLYFRSQFPDAQLIYKFGNHEERLEKYCWSKAPELVNMPHISWQGLLTIDNELNKIPELKDIIWVGEQRPIMCGKLPIFHGHELPKGLTNSVNPARGAFLRMIDTALIGHHHRSSSHVEYDWRHNPINCWSVGCLCDLTPEYARINKWNHGHALVEVSDKKNFQVHNFKQMDGNEVVTA
jgi:predicted phosphodiesterase